MGLLQQHFRPEFLNRVDDTVLFTPLSHANTVQVVMLFMQSFMARLAEQHIDVTVDANAHA